jgi:hypothetical protein
MKWKRKGGRSVAEEAGCSFRVEDDGAYSWKNPAGEWVHGNDRASTVIEARNICEEVAAAHSHLNEAEALVLAERRKKADELAAFDPDDRRWAEGLAGLLVGVAHAEVTVDYVAPKLQGEARALFERLSSDTAIMEVLAWLPKEQARDRVMRSVLKSIQRQRQEGEAGRR